MIHDTAIINSSARLGHNVSVGAYSIIGGHVEIGDNTEIGNHVVIQGHTRIGKNNHIHQFVSLGDEPQDKKYKGEESQLLIGDGNKIREFCTVNRGTESGGGKTEIGDDNLLMAYVHIAHDCLVGNHTVFVNGATLGGHVEVGDYANLGANVLVHQFCHIGKYSYSSQAVILTKNLTPFTHVSGNRSRGKKVSGETEQEDARVKTYSINKVGLRRHGFSQEVIVALEDCYKRLIRKRENPHSEELNDLAKEHIEVKEFIEFYDTFSKDNRGILR